MRISDATQNTQSSLTAAACMSLALACLATHADDASAQDRIVPDTYLAVTANMQPADVELKADVIRWSSPEEREAVITALQGEDPAAGLRDLPTMGVVWRSNSAIGSSIKYAHRTETPAGSERITLVTDRAIGATSFNPWVANNPVTDAALDYSVIELTVEQTDDGQGTMSLSAEVDIDSESNLVSLNAGDGEPLLTNVRLAPQPYWARQD